MNFEIKQLSEKDEKKWDEFVKTNNNTTFYHQIGWKKVVEETYGHKPYYLFAENDVGDVVGVLPMFLIKNIFFGKRLVSVPFAPYGGVCCENGDIGNALINEAINTGKNLDVGYCEFRNFKNTNTYENFNCMKDYSTFILDLSNGGEHIWKNMSRKVRNMIRKGGKSNLKFEVEASHNALSEFYEIYSKNMKQLGTPVHRLNFFNNIHRIFPENVFIAKVELNEELIASLYLLKFKDMLVSGWGASLAEFLKYAPNDFMYWYSITYGCENNMVWFDFGRSLTDSGNYKFKERWGSVEVTLLYYYYPPTKTITALQNEYGKLAKIWSKLPLKATNIIGPRVRRYIV
ncbi:FemAB family PEP-CTERM system-associated protein [ANME-1 cluster archaeon AG-394-G06]|nr:FemAB family PEP-CTERM system-associated protein [ANME-1 cluster archaeon AG-394-G06]